ncbi:unnamed protein product [Periconia digitata]|uniref:Secreted protein n=1 Tax=Periconia digitata TaxID=1303443 RepID=A0A9W4UQ83_9PLEO|nr:unnamed protein product [Periconia digitata]
MYCQCGWFSLLGHSKLLCVCSFWLLSAFFSAFSSDDSEDDSIIMTPKTHRPDYTLGYRFIRQMCFSETLELVPGQ